MLRVGSLLKYHRSCPAWELGRVLELRQPTQGPGPRASEPRRAHGGHIHMQRRKLGGAQRGQALAQEHLAQQQTEAGFLPLSPALPPRCYIVGSHPPLYSITCS